MLENSLDLAETTMRTSFLELPRPLRRHEDTLMRRFLFPMIVRSDRLLSECVFSAEALASSGKESGIALLSALEEEKERMGLARKLLDAREYVKVVESFSLVRKGLEKLRGEIDSSLRVGMRG